jgi:F0F1-type ATP synthase membrane subunit b/b'
MDCTSFDAETYDQHPRLSAQEYARKRRRAAYEQYKEIQKKERSILKAKKEKDQQGARQEKTDSLRSLLIRASELPSAALPKA